MTLAADRPQGGLAPAALLALLSGRPYAEVAELEGVSESTLRRRLKDPVIRAEIREARSWQLDNIMGGLADIAPKAITTLAALLDCGNENVRVAAARTILESLLRYREQGDLAARIAEVEEALAKVQP